MSFEQKSMPYAIGGLTAGVATSHLYDIIAYYNLATPTTDSIEGFIVMPIMIGLGAYFIGNSLKKNSTMNHSSLETKVSA